MHPEEIIRHCMWLVKREYPENYKCLDEWWMLSRILWHFDRAEYVE